MLGLTLAGRAVAGSPSSPTDPGTASPQASKTEIATKDHTTSHSGSATSTHKSTASATRSSHSRKGSRKNARKRGQQVIDSTRARQIQEALIREHYMQGEPSGRWDTATQAAMQRYQADQGWQSKTTPDSRALIKLGLGPSQDHLLNPESAMTSADPKPAAKPEGTDPATPSPAPNNRPEH